MADVKGLGKTVALGAVEGLGPKLANLTKGVKELKAEVAFLKEQVAGTPVANPTKKAAATKAAPAKAAAKKAAGPVAEGGCIMGNDPTNCADAALSKYQGGGCRGQSCKAVNAEVFRNLRAAKKAREAGEVPVPAKKATPTKAAAPTKGAAKKVAAPAKKASAR